MNEELIKIGKQAKAASYKMAQLDTVSKNQILNQFADELVNHIAEVLTLTKKIWQTPWICRPSSRIG